MVGEGSVWVNFMYERFSDICFVCGIFGYIYKGCFLYDDDVFELKFLYGNWLRALLLKRRRRRIG